MKIMTVRKFNKLILRLIRKSHNPTGNVYYLKIEDISNIEIFLSMFRVGNNEYDILGNTVFIN